MNKNLLIITWLAVSVKVYCLENDYSGVIRLDLNDNRTAFFTLPDDNVTSITSTAELDKLSLFIENMECEQTNENEGFRGLKIKGSSGREWSVCDTFNYETNKNVQDTYYKFSGEESYEIIQEGDWIMNPTSAKFRVSIYTESAKCSECPSDTFCCGNSKQCYRSFYEGDDETRVMRCIPKSLRCDGYLDCGRRCDSDESTSNCVLFYYFIEWNLMYTLCTIFIFAILIPALVITAINFHRKSQTLRRSHNAARQRQDRIRAGMISVDQPPNYVDVQQTKNTLPCFCQAVKMEHGNTTNAACSCKTNQFHNVEL